MFFNIGFQFNYGEPFALANFYNATYYQNIFNSREFKAHDSASLDNRTEIDRNLLLNPTNDGQTEDIISKMTKEQSDIKGQKESRSIDGSDDLVGKDVTAAQLYESIEDNFVE